MDTRRRVSKSNIHQHRYRVEYDDYYEHFCDWLSNTTRRYCIPRYFSYSVILFAALYIFISLYQTSYDGPIDWDVLRGNLADTNLTIDGKSSWNVFETCDLPDYDPLTPEIFALIYLHKDTLANCDRNYKKWTNFTDGRIVATRPDIHCEARCLNRVSDKVISMTDFVPVDNATFECEVVQAQCNRIGYKLNPPGYSMVHIRLIPQPKPKRKPSGKKFDTYVILTDSVSAGQAKRLFRKTLQFLDREFEAIWFPYLNKVGKNSRPNAWAIQYGLSNEVIDRTLFNIPNIPQDYGYNEWCLESWHGKKKSIFREFSQNGYKTLYADDQLVAAPFWLECHGYTNRTSDADHETRPFMNYYKSSGDKTLRRHHNAWNCIKLYDDVLNYTSQFIQAYPDIPKFGFVWQMEDSHENADNSIILDSIYYRFLKEHKEQLDNAFVVFMADHGMRFTRIVRTHTGRLEANNPMLSISVPRDLRQTKLPSVLRQNAKKLQTQFDVHATLLDIAEYSEKAGFNGPRPPTKYGNSLLRQQPDFPRTCQTLPIPSVYCICQYNTKQIDGNSKLAINLGKYAIEEMNHRLAKVNLSHLCVPIEFEQVAFLSAFEPEEQLRSYELEVKSKYPISGHYKMRIHIEKEVPVMSWEIDRADSYGGNGHCAPYDYEHICFCKDKIPSFWPFF